MVMYSNDSLKAVMAQVVPVVFLAMHDRPKAEDEGECGRVWVSVGGCVCVCVEDGCGVSGEDGCGVSVEDGFG